MTSTQRALLIGSVAVAGLLAILYVSSSTILLNGFANLEMQSARRDAQRVEEALTNELASLDRQASDWANWDDTYAFVADTNPNYIKSNLTDKAFIDLHLNLMVFVDAAGKTAYSKGLDLLTGSPLTIPEELRALLVPGNQLLEPATTGHSEIGFLQLPRAPLLVVAKPILTSDGQGPARGTLIFGRYLDDAEVAHLAQLTHFALSLRRLDQPLPPDFQAARAADPATTPLPTRVLDSQTVAAYTRLADIYGQPIALLRLALPRMIYAQGRASLGFFHITVLILSLGFGSVILALLLRLMRRTRRESEAMYRAVIEQTSDGMLLVEPSTQRVVETNIAAQRLLGYAPGEFCRLTLADLAQPGETGAPELQALLTADPKHGHTTETKYRRSNGSTVDVEASLSLIVYDGKQRLCLALRDITERKQAEETLRNRTAELALLLQAGRAFGSTLDLKELYARFYHFIARSVPCDTLTISAFDPETQLIHCRYLHTAAGEGECAHYPPIPLEPEGQDTQSLVIRTGQSLCLPNYETQRQTAATKYYTGDQDQQLAEAISPDADRPRSALLVPFVLEGNVIGVLQVFSYTLQAHTETHLRLVEALAFRMTASLANAALFQRAQAELMERQRAEAATRQLNAELEQRVTERTLELHQVNAKLEQAMRAKDEFMANMSHELRTPLTAILGLSESLQMQTYGPLTAGQIKSLQTIHAGGEHLLALITDVLDLAKIGAGKLELQLGPVEVEDYCEACIRLVRPQANKKQLTLTAHFDPAVDSLEADGRRFKQMLVNLLSNAVKFTPAGGRLGLEVTGNLAQGQAHFVVWDTGLGISPENQRRLFQPFTQVESSLSRLHEGAGLGLVLVRQLAEMHGGSISVESEGVPGQGSRFTLSLPWRSDVAGSHPLEDRVMPDLSPATPLVRPIGGQAPLVLMAEDNAPVASALADMLRAQGYAVRIAADGVAALELAHAQPPAVILMDVQLPQLNGLEAIGRLRANPALAGIPIIALTALAMPGDRERCLAAGANDYLSKPVKFHRLLHLLQELLPPPVAASHPPEEKSACI